MSALATSNSSSTSVEVAAKKIDLYSMQYQIKNGELWVGNESLADLIDLHGKKNTPPESRMDPVALDQLMKMQEAFTGSPPAQQVILSTGEHLLVYRFTNGAVTLNSLAVDSAHQAEVVKMLGGEVRPVAGSSKALFDVIIRSDEQPPLDLNKIPQILTEITGVRYEFERPAETKALAKVENTSEKQLLPQAKTESAESRLEVPSRPIEKSAPLENFSFPIAKEFIPQLLKPVEVPQRQINPYVNTAQTTSSFIPLLKSETPVRIREDQRTYEQAHYKNKLAGIEKEQRTESPVRSELAKYKKSSEDIIERPVFKTPRNAAMRSEKKSGAQDISIQNEVAPYVMPKSNSHIINTRGSKPEIRDPDRLNINSVQSYMNPHAFMRGMSAKLSATSNARPDSVQIKQPAEKLVRRPGNKNALATGERMGMTTVRVSKGRQSLNRKVPKQKTTKAASSRLFKVLGNGKVQEKKGIVKQLAHAAKSMIRKQILQAYKMLFKAIKLDKQQKQNRNAVKSGVVKKSVQAVKKMIRSLVLLHLKKKRMAASKPSKLNLNKSALRAPRQTRARLDERVKASRIKFKASTKVGIRLSKRVQARILKKKMLLKVASKRKELHAQEQIWFLMKEREKVKRKLARKSRNRELEFKLPQPK